MDQQPVDPINPSIAQPPLPQTEPALPLVPETWPGAFGAYKYSKQAVLRNWQTLLTLLVSYIVITIVLSIGLRSFGSFIADVVSLFLSLAIYIVLLGSVRGQELAVGEAFKKCDLSLVGRYILSNLLLGVISFVSFLLFIVPFLIVLPRIILAPYFLIDRHLGPVGAVQASWAATKGHAGKIWGIIGAQIAMALLFITLIGIPFALYLLFMYSATNAVLYEYLAKHATAVAPIPAPPVV